MVSELICTVALWTRMILRFLTAHDGAATRYLITLLGKIDG